MNNDRMSQDISTERLLSLLDEVEARIQGMEASFGKGAPTQQLVEQHDILLELKRRRAEDLSRGGIRYLTLEEMRERYPDPKES